MKKKRTVESEKREDKDIKVKLKKRESERDSQRPYVH